MGINFRGVLNFVDFVGSLHENINPRNRLTFSNHENLNPRI